MTVWTKIYVLEEPKLEKPILIQGLPGLGFVGKLTVTYLIDELGLKPFARLYSTHLTLLDGSTGIQINSNGTFFLPKFEFYAYNQKKPNIIFLTGDTQPTVYGQYEVAEHVLDFVQKYGCEKIIAVGGFQTPFERELGKVYGVFNKPHLGEELKSLGVNITRSGAITGACGIILGLGDQRNLESVGLLGATKGEYPDMEAAREVLKVVTKILGLEINLEKLNREIIEMKRRLESLHRIQTEAIGQITREFRRGPSPFYV